MAAPRKGLIRSTTTTIRLTGNTTLFATRLAPSPADIVPSKPLMTFTKFALICCAAKRLQQEVINKQAKNARFCDFFMQGVRRTHLIGRLCYFLKPSRIGDRIITHGGQYYFEFGQGAVALQMMMKSVGVFCSALSALLVCSHSLAGAERSPSPFTVADNLFDLSKPDTLGLEMAPDIETFTVYRAEETTPKYNHGAVLIPFKEKLYAQWQSSERDEDASDTFVAYAVSDDGVHWSSPKTLATSWDGGIKTSGGWWTDGETLIAYIAEWPQRENAPRGGYTEYVTSTDGETWSEPKRVLASGGEPVNGIIEQDPHALPDGRIVTAFHEQPGIVVAPYYTDDPLGISGWTKGDMENLPHEGDVSREIEPSWFRRADGALVMVFRDQASSFKKLASISYDRGVKWTRPQLTLMPDSRSKQSAGNLPSGAAFQVNNPSGSMTRYPLAITLSSNGFHFDRAFLIRAGGDELQPLRYEGKYKRAGYSYPKSVVWGEHLYVAYATNKEDIEVSRIPLSALEQ